MSLQLAVMQDIPERWSHLSEAELAARERDALPFTVLVNLAVTPVGGNDQAGFSEGCLSVPGLAAVVARHRAVRVKALDEHGEPVDRVQQGGRPGSSSTRPTTSADACTWTGPKPGR